MDQTPGNDHPEPAGAQTAGNPFFSSALNGGLLPAASCPQPGQVVELVLGSHTLPLTSGDGGRLVIEGYDTEPVTGRSLWHTNCTLSFQVGNGPTQGCAYSSIHFLDDTLMFKAGDGQIAESTLGPSEYYFLAVPPDVVVAVERQVAPSAQGIPVPVGFRVVLVNPIGNDPLVVSVTGVDSQTGAALVDAGVAFMRNQVGSEAGWRPIDDGWETMEWNGPPPSSINPIPAATQVDDLPDASAGVAPAGVVAVTTGAAATGPDDISFVPSDEPKQGNGNRLLVAVILGVGVLLLIGWFAATLLGDDDATDPTEVAADGGGSTDDSTTTVETTSTTEATTTTTVETTTTTTEATTTTPPTTTEPVPAGQQLATWGFLERTELANPSGDAACPPAATPTSVGTVVGVGEALNIRDGADSSFEIVQRIKLGYDEVTVFPSILERSARGTEWVQIALPVPPGWVAPADDTDAFPYGCGWAATQFLEFDRA